MDTVILITSGGNSTSDITMQQMAEEYNGTVKTVVEVFNQEPNEGNAKAVDLAEQAGREIFP